MSNTALTAIYVESHLSCEKKKLPVVPCKNKFSFCQKYRKDCCGKHAFGKSTIVTCKNC